MARAAASTPIVNEDGTCSREYTFHTTQQWLAAAPDEDYDSIVDKSWERSWSVLGADSVRYPVPLTEAQLDSMQALDNSQPLGNMLMVHCRKTYGSVEEMSAHLYRADGSHLVEVRGIKASSRLEKRFKWFYTDYTFSETFAYDGEPVFPVPISRFLGADTVAYWFTGQPDLMRNLSGAEMKDRLDKIEAKVSQWANANWFTEICNIIIENYDIISMRDSLAMLPQVLNLSEKEWGAPVFSGELGEFFQSDAYSSFLKSYEGGPGQYTDLLSFGMPYDLVMPGTVTDAGMGEYDGEVIHYQLGGERLIPGAYTISATSRVTNIWAFVVTLLVILLAVGSWFYLRKRQ